MKNERIEEKVVRQTKVDSSDIRPQNDVVVLPSPYVRGIEGEGAACRHPELGSGSIHLMGKELTGIDRFRPRGQGHTLRMAQRFPLSNKFGMTDGYWERGKSAFTLAEILITLTIIGVVAALTLPGVMTDTRERQTVIKLKRIYSILQNVEIKMRAEHGGMNEWNDDSSAFFLQELSKHLNVVKKCDNGYFCSRRFPETSPAVILADGTAIAVGTRVPNTSCSAKVNTRDRIQLHYNYCASVLVDINNTAKPNRLGEDAFDFRFFTNGVLPNGVNNNNNGYSNVEAEDFGSCLRGRGGHWACTAWVIEKENLDYLHCPDKIGYDKASSCKDK